MQLGSNALRAQQIGLQVVGQNIANANTPGYIREEVVLTPAGTQRFGGINLGLGVQVEAVIQKIDKFLEERLRGAGSDRASSEVQEESYLQLEQLVGELGDTDLSTSLNNFFTSISSILNQPESVTVRNLAVLQGKTLASDLQRLVARARQLRTDVNDRITNQAADINRLIEEVRDLNVKITETEGSDTSKSDAVGLRDQRGEALRKLADLIDIKVNEESNGATNVFAGGDFLIFQGISRRIDIASSSDRGLTISTLQLAGIDAPLQFSSGEVAGLTVARDEILGGFLDQLDEFSSTLIYEFNKVYSVGQGLNGFQQSTSEFAVDDATVPLDAAGLPFTPVNGSFQVLVFNRQTGLTETTDVPVDLDGLNDDDTTLTTLAAALNAIDGLSASVTATRHLQIDSDAENQDFAFANDTSGLLTALGVNTFFSGSSAGDIRVNQVLVDDPAKFAASRDGIGGGTSNAVELADFLDRPLDSRNQASMAVLYDGLIGDITQQSSVSSAVAQGFRVFEETLNGQKLSISGVSLDEEAVRLITFQRAYQASARFIATMSELLQLLVNL